MASRDQRRQATGAPPGAQSPAETPDPSTGRPTLARRRLFGAAAGVTAASLVAMASPARAQSQVQGTTTPGTTPGSAPTTAPVGTDTGDAPTVEGADLELVRFARSVELALVDLYDRALESGRLKAVATDQAHVFHSHHKAHAERMAGFGGSAAPNSPNAALVAQLGPRVDGASNERALIEVLGDIEQRAAATYQALLGDVDDWQLAQVFAQIAPVDSQHVAAWNRVGIADDREWAAQIGSVLPANPGTDGRWDPLQFPVGAA